MPIGTACLVRQKKPNKYWKNPDKPEYYDYRIKIRRPDGSQTMTSANTSNLAVAKKRLDLVKKRMKDARWEELDDFIVSRRVPTVGDVVETYLAPPQTCKEATAVKGANELLNVVAIAKGLVTSTKSGRPIPDKAAARKLASTVLTDDLVLEYQRVRQGGELDISTRQESNGGINSTLNNARGVFSKKSLYYKFKNFNLPDVAGFMQAPYLPVPDQEWEPIPDDQYQSMDEASAVLRSSNPELWLVNQMLRRLGLRNCELIAARDTWLDQDGAGWLLVVKDRPDEGFWCKGFRSRRLPLSPDLAEILTGRQGWLLEAPSDTARTKLVEREHNTWLRQFVPDRQKGNHELRKHIGSVIYHLRGLEAAADYLGHVDIRTTRKWYQARLERLPQIAESDLKVVGKIEKLD